MPVKPRTAALAGAAVVTVGALLVLMLRVSSSRDYELSPEARAEAAARHQRLGARAVRAPQAGAAAVRPRGLRSRSRPEPPARAATEEPDDAAGKRLRTFTKSDDDDTVGKTPPGMGVVQRLTAMRARAGDAKLAPGVTRDEGIRVRMSEAQALFADKRYDEAVVMAVSVLETAPKNIRMLRLAVSASCLGGDLDTAREFLERLPVGDQSRMRKKCAEFGVEL